MCFYCFPDIYNRYYGDILRTIYPLFGESEPDDAVRDNAAGAIARMIMVHPESIPLNQVNILFGQSQIIVPPSHFFSDILIAVKLVSGPPCFLESSSSEGGS